MLEQLQVLKFFLNVYGHQAVFFLLHTTKVDCIALHSRQLMAPFSTYSACIARVLPWCMQCRAVLHTSCTCVVGFTLWDFNFHFTSWFLAATLHSRRCTDNLCSIVGQTNKCITENNVLCALRHRLFGLLL